MQPVDRSGKAEKKAATLIDQDRRCGGWHTDSRRGRMHQPASAGSSNDAAGLAGEGLPEHAEAVGTVPLELVHDLRTGLPRADAEEPTGQQIERQTYLFALSSIGGRHQDGRDPHGHHLITHDTVPLGAEVQLEEVGDRTEGHVERAVRALGHLDGVAVKVDGLFALWSHHAHVRRLAPMRRRASTPAGPRLLVSCHSCSFAMRVPNRGHNDHGWARLPL